MAAVYVSSPSPIVRGSYIIDDDVDMSTLRDPRSRIMTPTTEFPPASPTHHPDLSNEVATLSTKLINAINHQTNLDDNLSTTRHELRAARERVRELEQENQEHALLLKHGVLVRRTAMEAEQTRLIEDLCRERQQRSDLEKAKKRIEQELENLTTALFEEANKMVITAREDARNEHDLVVKRNEQLKTQLAETQSLLRSQQEQLSELKQVMEHLSQRDDHTNPTAPSTPAIDTFDLEETNAFGDHNTAHSLEPTSPSHPLSFSYLIQPVLRTDLSAYDDFISLLHSARNATVAQRASSGSLGNLGLGLGLSASNSSNPPSTPGANPATAPSTPSSSSANTSTSTLKDAKFYKRALAEDVEPTLRLDAAPGLSWLARRTVLTAVCEGDLIVEPIPANIRKYNFPCTLCGDARKDSKNVRAHRFRTSESESAQRYPLCKYCLGRVRSTCDFLSFLRVIKEGHWRADDTDSEQAAWEESVRLREQMFWCRMGGGVVPVVASERAHSQDRHDALRSPRITDAEHLSKVEREQRRFSQEVEKPREAGVSAMLTPPLSATSPTLPKVVELPPAPPLSVISTESNTETANIATATGGNSSKGEASTSPPTTPVQQTSPPEQDRVSEKTMSEPVANST